MRDRPLHSDTGEARTRVSDNYVVWGIVAVCLLMALVLLGGGLLDSGGPFASREKISTPGAPQSDPQTPAMGQASPEAPPTLQPDAIGPAAQPSDLPPDLQIPTTQPSPQATPAPENKVP
jgi:hypothetical protein